jgi:glycosyltransferase 2 family protein
MPNAEDVVPVRSTAGRGMPSVMKFLLRVAAAAILVTLLSRRLDWDEFRGQLARCDWRWWTLGFLIGLASTTVAAIRWAALARPLGFPQTLGTFIWRFFEGQFFSLCLPGSIGGDVVKAYRLADNTSGRLLAGCTVLADRLTGVAALGVLAGAAIAAREFALALPATLAVAAGLMVAVMLVFRLGVGSIDLLMAFVSEPRVSRLLGGLMPYQQRPGLILQAVGWSFVVQLGGAFTVACIGRGLGVSLPIAAWLAVVPLVALAMAVPVSIGAVGVREGLLQILLGRYGVPAETAIAIGILWFLSTIAIGVLGGLFFMLEPRRTGSSPAERPADVSEPQPILRPSVSGPPADGGRR